MFSGTNDVTCPYHLAKQTSHTIPSVTAFIPIPGQDHGYFGHSNSPEFMAQLIEQLQIPTEEELSFRNKIIE